MNDCNVREKSILQIQYFSELIKCPHCRYIILHNHPDGSILMQFNQRVNACVDKSHLCI